MNAPKPLLKNLGAKLRLMMAEDWRGEDERNTLGMAGHWLEKLGEDQQAQCDQCRRVLLPDLEESRCVVCSESCQCNDRAAVYRDGVPWCINCHAQILSKCEPPPMGDALCESRRQGESRAPSAHASDALIQPNARAMPPATESDHGK
jgi:hypothetical protein